ncbi:MAG: hypothetical protein HY688_00720 [Chloroflexi bacterium]|nr:hypothetical protein [Chloroflexota bacterium]
MTSQAPVVPCPVCGQPLALRLARGRKSGKPFLMLLCAADGRHLRGFIGDSTYVAAVLARLEAQGGPLDASLVPRADRGPDRPSGDDLERDL